MELGVLGHLDGRGNGGVRGLADRLASVEGRLHDTVAIDGPSLASPSRRMTGAGGKRLRPAFVIAAADCGGVFDERVRSAAVAVELVQAGSLVHDDLFEGAATRRGVPTINSVEGEDHALLAGDFLLARAGAEAAAAGADVAVDLAATIVALCEGQMAEMHHVHDVDRPIASYLAAIRGKTAELFACALRSGARCAGLAGEDVGGLGRFGLHFGMAFQLLDDVLDLIADPGRLGKPVGIDIATGVYTLPVLLELAGPRGGELRRLLQRRTPTDVTIALRLLADSEHLDTALAEARRHALLAEEAIGRLPGQAATALRAFPATYLDWALEHFTAPSGNRGTG